MLVQNLFRGRYAYQTTCQVCSLPTIQEGKRLKPSTPSFPPPIHWDHSITRLKLCGFPIAPGSHCWVPSTRCRFNTCGAPIWCTDQDINPKTTMVLIRNFYAQIDRI